MTKVKTQTKERVSLKAKLMRFGSTLMMPISIVAFAMILGGIASTFAHIDSVDWLHNIFTQTTNVILGIFPLLVALSITNTYAKEDKGMNVINTLILYLVFIGFQHVFISYDSVNANYDIWFYKNIDASLITTTLGMKNLNTSIFGGIVIAFISLFVYQRTYKIMLPKPLVFFSGSRLPPILMLLIAPFVASLFILTWPGIGYGIIKMGEGMMYLPAGLDAFFYGVMNRLLLPFGLHTILMSVFTLSSATGVLTENGTVIATGDYMIWHAAYQRGIPFDLIQAGGTFVWEGNTYTITNNVNPGQFEQGFYPIMIFAFPAAGLAMSLKSNKENKWMAIFLVSFIPMLSGVTETFEYLFVFTHPILYLFHSLMTGISFMLMDWQEVSMGMSSGWAVDVILFGIIPQVQGNITNVHIMPIIGAIMFVSYFAFFYILYYDVEIKDVDTPLNISTVEKNNKTNKAKSKSTNKKIK